MYEDAHRGESLGSALILEANPGLTWACNLLLCGTANRALPGDNAHSMISMSFNVYEDKKCINEIKYEYSFISQLLLLSGVSFSS